MSAASKLTRGMDFDVWREAWFELCRERGHTLKIDEDFGGINQFVTSGGICNGPGCATCGWTACMHCDAMGKKIPQCTAVANAASTVGPAEEQT